MLNIGLLSDAEESAWCEGIMWKFEPDWVESIELGSSTEGKGWRSRVVDVSGGGGVRVCWRGEAV